METSFKKLTLEDKNYITQAYRDAKENDLLMSDVQKNLAKRFGVTRRTIRNWAKSLALNLNVENITNPFKVLVYDIETSRAPSPI